MKRLLLIIFVVLMVFAAIPLKSIAIQYAILGSEDEALTKILYQYYYSEKENKIKVEFVTSVKSEDQISCAEMVNAKMGDTFTGPSRTTYKLQEQNILCEKQIQYLANQDIVVIGEWVSVPELKFNFSGFPVYYGLCIDGVMICEIFIPESEGGGPGGCVSVVEVSCDK